MASAIEQDIKTEPNKRAGIYYAVTPGGLELPIVDLTHPAFARSPSVDELGLLRDRFLREQASFAKLPAIARRFLLWAFLRGSILAEGLRAAEGTFLAGLSTYLFKLPPDLLGSAYAKPIDRKMAEGLPAIGIRLRLADMARFAADALIPALAAAPARGVTLFNIAGGPSMDSVNALLLLQRERPELLEKRSVRIVVLDGDEAGPLFGSRALAALRAEGAPLHDVRVTLERQPYDFRDPMGLSEPMARARGEGDITLASSEGGLFEYGSDDDIVGNLIALREGGGAEVGVVGSVTRDDEVRRLLKLTSHAATIPRGLSVFTPLCERAGFSVARSVARPLSDDVHLTLVT